MTSFQVQGGAVAAREDAVAERPGRVPDAAPVVELDRVGYTYNSGTEAIRDVSLRVDRGRVLGVVGPSGCGKSTILKIITGRIRPTTGEARIQLPGDGQSKITMVFQEDTLFPWATVRDNAAVFTRFAAYKAEGSRPSAAELDERVTHLLNLVHLSDVDRKFPYQLSGGMRRRLEFVSAVAPHPALLLLDEPFSAIDEPTRVQIHQEILPIIRELGMSVVLITHDLGEALSLSDEIAIFSRAPGTIVRTHHVPFGEERDITQLRQSGAFLDLYGELWRDLGAQIHVSGTTKGR